MICPLLSPSDSPFCVLSGIVDVLSFDGLLLLCVSLGVRDVLSAFAVGLSGMFVLD